MENKEILNQFGQLVISYVYDDALKYFKSIKDGTTKWNTGKEYTDVLNKLSDSDKDILYKYLRETINTSIFAFLKIFEEHTEFKIIYNNKNGDSIDLNKISEMLKAEHNGEDGWIDRFSEEIKK